MFRLFAFYCFTMSKNISYYLRTVLKFFFERNNVRSGHEAESQLAKQSKWKKYKKYTFEIDFL